MKKISAIIISLLICVSTFLCTSCSEDKNKEQANKSTCELAIIDSSSIYKLQAFLKANEKINEARASLEQSYAEKMKNASDDSQRADINALFEKDLQAVINKETTPLKDRVQAAIALVSADKKITVVMDKSVVVTGAEDITDAVKDKFREEGNLNAPDVDINSSVAYFDQDVVRSLPMFRDSDKKMREAWTKAREDIATKSKTMTDEQIRVLTADYEKKLKAMNDSISVPLLKKVNDTVTEIAKEKKYTLVVGKEYVMYGGKNITDEVVDRLLGKKTSSTSSSKGEK